MKTARKVMLLAMCAVLLVCATIAGTVAYLKSTTAVVQNTFTVGDVEILLDEKDTDNSNTVIEGAVISEAGRDHKNAYHLLPGQTYEKDPRVTVVANSEDCYVRMLVTVNNISELKAAFDESYVVDGVFLLQNLVDWNTAWEYVSCTEDAAADTAVYEFRYNAVVAKSAANNSLPALFEHIIIPGDISNESIALLNAVSIDVVAHAMQATGFNDATAAWNAWGN